MKTQFIALHRGRSQVALAICSALSLGSSLASAQAAPAAPAAAPGAAAPAEPAPAPVAPSTGAPSQPTPLPEPGTGAQAGTVDATAPTAAPPGPSAPATPPPAGTAAAVDTGVTPEAGGETAEPVQEDGGEVLEELSDEGGKINIYGFSDFTYNHLLSDKKTTGSQTGVGPNPSFYVGNLNVYLDTNLGKKWRSLVELRFTYLPDGVTGYDMTTFQSLARTSTAYPDYTDYGRTKKVGGVIIERAWVEYAAHPFFNIRLGQWLTPYGIWNVDHGSPVILGITRPYIVGSEWLPQRQTGIETYGSYGIENTQVGYHLTLSNGRGPIDSYMDLDTNKAIGWRLWLRQDTPVGTVAVGTSGYRGRYTDSTQGSAMENGAYITTYTLTSRYDELGLAADLKYTWGGFLFQSEFIMRDTRYDDNFRPASFGSATPAWTPDNRVWGFYFQTGYRLPWYGIMPWIGYEYDRLGKSSFLYDATDIVGGLNVRPTDRIVLKVVGLHVWQPYLKDKSVSLDQLMAQIAWSF